MRSGVTPKIYINGVGQSGSILNGTINISGVFNIGITLVGIDAFQGYIDEFRVSKGIARWTADFTPPTEPYSSVNLVRTILEQDYGLLPNAILRQILSQPYHLTAVKRAILEQIYGLRMLAVFSQLYGDMPVRRAVLEQFYGDNTFLRRMLAQEYGDAARYRGVLDQEWASFEGLRSVLVQRYSITEKQVRAMVDENYDLSERDQVRALMDQLYVLAAGEALVQSSDIGITAVNDSEFREITSAWNINIEQDEGLYHMVGELQIADADEYAFLIHLETVVTIVVDGFSSEFIPLDPRRQRSGNGTVYIVPLVSKSVLLDHAESDYSLTEDTDLSGMAKTIVTGLAFPVALVDWQMVNWFIPTNKLYTNGDTAMTVIKRIVNAGGGVVQTSPDGMLVCRPEYPVSVDKWITTEPDIELTDQDDFFQIMPQEDPRDGFNRFFISDEQLGSDGLTIDEVQISARKKEVRVFMVPWDATATIILHHSGGSWVSIVADGVRESEETEQVEFTIGAGSVSHPVYGSVVADWAERDLGNVTASEEGNLVADLDQNSLADVTYTTRYFKFIVTDDKVEDVQVYPEMA